MQIETDTISSVRTIDDIYNTYKQILFGTNANRYRYDMVRFSCKEGKIYIDTISSISTLNIDRFSSVYMQIKFYNIEISESI